MAKRRKGAGRPTEGPHDNQAVTLLTRVTVDTKRRLDQERALRAQQAERKKLSMSQVVETLLKEALTERSRRRTGREVRARALGTLVTMMAERAELEAKLAWSSDPYTFKMLSLAIGYMLDKLAPDGPLVVPERFAKRLEEMGPNPSETTISMMTKPEMTAWNLVAGPILHSLGAAQVRFPADEYVNEAARLLLERLADDLMPPLSTRSAT